MNQWLNRRSIVSHGAAKITESGFFDIDVSSLCHRVFVRNHPDEHPSIQQVGHITCDFWFKKVKPRRCGIRIRPSGIEIQAGDLKNPSDACSFKKSLPVVAKISFLA